MIYRFPRKDSLVTHKSVRSLNVSCNRCHHFHYILRYPFRDLRRRMSTLEVNIIKVKMASNLSVPLYRSSLQAQFDWIEQRDLRTTREDRTFRRHLKIHHARDFRNVAEKFPICKLVLAITLIKRRPHALSTAFSALSKYTTKEIPTKHRTPHFRASLFKRAKKNFFFPHNPYSKKP